MQRIAILTLLALFLVSSTAMAQPAQHQGQAGKGHRYATQAGPGFGGLNEEQHAAVSRLWEEHYRTIMPLRLQLQAKQAELDVHLVAPQADQAKITAVSNEISALHAQMLTTKTDFRRKVFEQTGHLIRAGMDRHSHGHALGGSKGNFHQRMGNCPRFIDSFESPDNDE